MPSPYPPTHDLRPLAKQVTGHEEDPPLTHRGAAIERNNDALAPLARLDGPEVQKSIPAPATGAAEKPADAFTQRSAGGLPPWQGGAGNGD